jgi:hypothetical protein
MFERQV